MSKRREKLINQGSRRYEDLRFPATAINPPGQVGDPDFDTTNGGWLFAAGGTEILFVIAQLPHACKEGSIIRPHVHWQKTTSAGGDVLWQLDYKWSPIDEVMDVGFTTISSATIDSITTDNDTANEHLITSLGDVAATGKGMSDILVMKVSRIGGDETDTYGADARFLEFDIHYEVDSLGSRYEYVK